MKTKICIAIIGSLFLISCEFGTHFKIKNESNSNIEFAIFSNGINKIRINNIDKNKQFSGFLDFSNDGPKHDGNYGVEVHYNGTIRKQKFGYYSNGILSGVAYEIIIKNDTIIVHGRVE